MGPKAHLGSKGPKKGSSKKEKERDRVVVCSSSLIHFVSNYFQQISVCLTGEFSQGDDSNNRIKEFAQGHDSGLRARVAESWSYATP